MFAEYIVFVIIKMYFTYELTFVNTSLFVYISLAEQTSHNYLPMMKTPLFFLVLLALCSFSYAQSGSISNIQISQHPNGNEFIDIRYDLSGSAAAYNILLEASFDGSSTFTPVSSTHLEDAVSGVSPGSGRQNVLNGMGSFPNQYSTRSHIWLTTISGEAEGDWPRDTITKIVDVLNPATGKTWMDRNLGASRAATMMTDADAYGDLYQWGRAADGHQKRDSGTASTLSSSDTPGHGYYITVNSSPYDWRSPQNDNLWKGVNGVNNPCPTGYRLPTEAELNAERLSWRRNNRTGAFASPLKLPVAGCRTRNDGSLCGLGSCGFYWSSTVDGVYSRSLRFRSGLRFLSCNANTASFGRAHGRSVRCIKD